MAKQTVTKMITPPAIVAYAWFEKADEGQQYSDGKFKGTLKLSKKDKEQKSFIAEVKKVSLQLAEDLKQNDAAWKKLNLEQMKFPFRDGDEAGKEDFEGYYTLCAKTKYRPGMVDCSDPVKSLSEGDEPRSGDTIRMAVALIPYCMGGANFGISAQLRNVQLVERNNTGQADDFGSVSGGYQSSKTSSSGPTDDDDF